MGYCSNNVVSKSYRIIKGFMGQTTSFLKNQIKSSEHYGKQSN